MKELSRALARVRRRIRAKNALRGAEWGLLVGCGAALCVVAASFFVPMESRAWFAAGAGIGCPMGGLIAGLCFPVGKKEAARAADGCGLAERAVTALALETAPESPFRAVQARDALSAIASLDPRRGIPVKLSRWRSIASGAALVAFLTLLLVPNPQSEILRQRAAVREDLRETAQAVEEAAEKLDASEYDKETAREIRKILGDLAREIGSARDSREALEAVSGAEQLLKKTGMRNPAIAENALNNAGLSAVAGAARQGEAAVAEALQSEASSSGAESAAEKLEAAAGAAENAGDEKAAEELREAAESMKKGDATAAAAAVGQATAGAAAGAGASSSGKIAGILSSARTGSAQAGSQAGTGAGSGGDQGSGQGAGSGSDQGSGQGSGDGQGSGQGSGSGQGAGQGQGQGAGSGAGTGSTNQDAGMSSGGASGGGAGSRPPQYKTGEYEEIYDPTRLGDGGEVSASTGEVSDEGKTGQTDLGPGLGDASGSVPYDQVYSDYSAAAAKSAQRPSLPSYAKDWIGRYFASLID